MERREFLRIAGVTGTSAAAFGCSPKATERLIPYLVPQEEIVPGVATWYASASAESPEALGIQVKTREGRPILIQGNPEHPLSRGAVSALAQAEIQGLYDPDRIKGPAVRSSDTRFAALDWRRAERLLAQRLAPARDGGIYFLTGHLTGTLDSLIDRWLQAFGSPNRVAYEAFAHEPLLAANRLVFGREAIPLYDIARARYLISFGADFLETWIAPTYFSRGFTEMHAFRDGGMGRFVHVEPRMSLTAANADEWIAPRPGTEMLVALAMANAIGGDSGLAGVALDAYAPEAVAEQTEVPAATIRRLAREFSEARPSLALGPGTAGSHRRATETWAAVNALNQAAGNVGQTVRLGPTFNVAGGATYRAMEELVRRMNDGRVQALLVHDANPVFTLPPGLGFAEALARVPFKVSLSPFYDETAAMADLLLPASHSMESWGDSEPVEGVRGLMQPSIEPLHNTRMLGDILLSVARVAGAGAALPEGDFQTYLQQAWRGAGGTASGLFASLPEGAWSQALQRGGVFPTDLGEAQGGLPGRPGAGVAGTAASSPETRTAGRAGERAEELPSPDVTGAVADTAAPAREDPGQERETERERALVAQPGDTLAPFGLPGLAPSEGLGGDGVRGGGVAGGDVRPAGRFGPSGPRAAEPQAPAGERPGSISQLEFRPAEFDGDGEFHLIAFPTVAFYDGRGANKPWMQELPDPVTKAVWGSWVEVHPAAARRLGVKQGDVVEVASPHGSIAVPVFLYPGIRPDTVAVPIGQGHTEYGRYAKGRGANPIALLPADVDGVSGGRAWFGTRVTLRPAPAEGRLIVMQGSPHQHSRGIAQALSLAEAREAVADAAASESARLMEEIVADAAPDSPYRWGMTIDLAKCVGCSACVTACYMENNIKTVGPDDSEKGRELSWLRIERYWEEPEETGSLSVRHLPMLCQHCGQAPCEPVCPVYAAYHNPDGLNAQIYNRCVGTRYCSNNCPYKVRKFGFFEHTAPEPLNLQYNPDVTVRSKGVMEKCTFCVQRIREAKIHAGQEGREVRDGELVTACQAACPTQAIVFGNLRDPKSRVRREAVAGRGYSVLASLNTRSSISYLADVVHTDRPLRQSAGHGERGPSHGPGTSERSTGKRGAAVGGEAAPLESDGRR